MHLSYTSHKQRQRETVAMPTGDVNKNFRMGSWLVQPDLNRLVDGDRVVTLQPRMMTSNER